MNILVTSGATREPVDAVRFLSNGSSGASGATLADAWAARGHAVVLLRGEGAAAPRLVRENEIFSTAEDLRTRLERRLACGRFDAVVMVAGVSDYRPQSPSLDKLSSEPASVTLRLVRNPKIVPVLKSYSPRPLVVVGFKLTVGAGPSERHAAVSAQFASGGVDAVVHNDLEEIRRSDVHPFHLYRSPEQAPRRIEGAAALALELESVFGASRPGSPCVYSP